MKKKIISLALALTMMLGSTMTVCATSEGPVISTTNVSAPGTQTVEVNVTIDAAYYVTIPTAISPTVEDGTGSAEYTVNVKGDIEGDEQITVIPDATFTMSQDGKDDVTASITQAKTTFNFEELAVMEDEENVGTDATGSINIPGLTAGTWEGSFVFTISKSAVPPVTP